MNEIYKQPFQENLQHLSEEERELQKRIFNGNVGPKDYDDFALSRKHNEMAEASGKKLKSFLDDKEKYIGLEVGVGTGIYTAELNKIPNLVLKGIDLRKDMVDYGVLQNRFKKGQIVISDFHEIPFEDASFDLCTGLAITSQKEDVTKFYNEIRRVLRRGGFVFIPFTMPSREIIERETQNMAEQGLDVQEKGDWYIIGRNK